MGKSIEVLNEDSAMAEHGDQVRAHVYVSGRVQGVYFRGYTQEQARKRGVRGWVRNLPDGRVEAAFEGDRTAVQQMIEWCREGPPSARVDDIQARWEEATGQEQSFEARYWD